MGQKKRDAIEQRKVEAERDATVETADKNIRKTFNEYFHTITSEFKVQSASVSDFKDRFHVSATKMENRKIAEPDNLYSNLSLETYIEYRMAELLRRLERLTPIYTGISKFYENLVILMGLAGTLLAALGYEDYVAITVAIGAMLEGCMEHFAVVRRISAHGVAQRNLRNGLMWWNSLGAVEKSTHATADLACSIVEQVAMDIVTAWADGEIETQEAQDAENAHDELKKRQAKKDGHSKDDKGQDDKE